MPATERLLQSEGLPGVNVTQVWPVVWAVKQVVQVWKRNGSPCGNRFPWDSPLQQALGEQFWAD